MTTNYENLCHGHFFDQKRKWVQVNRNKYIKLDVGEGRIIPKRAKPNCSGNCANTGRETIY